MLQDIGTEFWRVFGKLNGMTYPSIIDYDERFCASAILLFPEFIKFVHNRLQMRASMPFGFEALFTDRFLKHGRYPPKVTVVFCSLKFSGKGKVIK